MMKIKRYIFLVAALLLMVQGASAWNGSGSSGDPYLIASPADWETFATSTDEYSETFFKLTADITVTTMRTKTFKGTFDGGGHTLTFNYTATGDNAAPFAYITGATIKNLRVAGTITTSNKFAAGIVSISNGGSIENCQSSVTIASSTSGDGTHGGLVAYQESGTLTINNCLFDGELLGASTSGCGGFVGWVANNSGYQTNISNSLFAPANITVTAYTFCRQNKSTLHLEASTCYYITPASTVQGTNAGSMTTASLVTALNNGGTNWCNNGGKATPILIFDYIGNQSNWNAFTSGINAGINYSGKTVKMSADFTATTMATSTFSGTFDGGGHTLTFNYTATGDNAAPFAYITGATIKNLRVAGTINTGYKYAAGIAAISNGGTITNCQSSVTINSSTSGDGTHGGLVADSYTGTLNINNCLFDGKLLGENTESCGGFVGWHKSGTLNISNSLFAPTQVTLKGGVIFARNGATSLTNCYYKSTWSATTVQGTNANSMTTAALVTALNGSNKNWCVHRGNAIPIRVNLVISTKAQWDTFAANVGNYDSKYVQLGANIGTANDPITTMTTSATSFKGIFDGNGHTLTVNLSGGGDVAPFQYLNGGTIMNLTVAGTVTSTTNYCSGLVARTSGGVCLIDNCVVNTNNDGVGYVGGVVAHADNATSLTISNCIYGGTIAIQPNGKDENYSGGIFGWYNWNNHTLDLTMTNCLCKGTYNGNGTFHPIGVKKSGFSIDTSKCHDCYYTTNPHNNPGSDRYVYAGTKVYSIIAGTDVTISGLGTATSTYEHNVITVYSHGIKYNLNSTDYYYAGGDEVVSLNLAHGSKTGYTFSNYEVSGGGSLSNLTATSATLTMSAANQTINAVWTKNAMTLLNDDSGQDKNDDRINAANGKVYDVTLSGRTLNKDKWNTLCVPFDISDPTTVFGTGVKVKTLSGYTNDGTTVTISFTDAATIEAGKPYIVMLPSGADDMVNPQFSGVTISNAALQGITAGDATFKGNYAPVALAKDDKTRLFLSSNKLYYPTAAVTVKPFRAYFELTSDVPTASGAPNLVIDFGETTGVGELRTENRRIENSFYDLQGRRLNGKPTQKGIYIHNGKLEVLK